MLMNSVAGHLIILEGIDGTGKSTQVEMLATNLRERGYEVVTSREPTEGPFGQKLRESMVSGRLSPEEELALFQDDRRDHVETLIKPALASGKVVILDRYYFSTMAYQGPRGFDIAAIREASESFAPIPDHVFILTLPVEIALRRIGNRDGAGNTFEQEQGLRETSAIFAAMDDSFIHHIDSDAPPELIQQRIAEVLFPE